MRPSLERLSVLAPPVAVIAATLAGWWLLVELFEIPPYLLPAPGSVLEAVWTERDRLAWGMLGTAIGASTGFAIAAAAGVAIGSVLGLSRFLERGFYPLTLLLQMVPLVALAPILVVWLGYGQRAVIASSAIVALFPVIANTLGGMRSVERELEELFTLYRASAVSRWWRLRLPASLPSIVTGLRIAAGLAVIGAIVGEFVSAYAGDRAPLGMVIVSAMKEYRTDLMFGAIGLAAIVGFALFGIVNLGGWLLLRRWHASARSSSD
ncbi:MAG: ABC transporter permease [Phycisphaerales bacterium]